MLIFVAVHIFCFWLIPITGNMKLYSTPICDTEN